MLGIIFALCAALFIALAQIALRKSYKEFKPSVGFFFDALFGLVLWVPLALVMGVTFGVSFEQAIFYAVISAILSEALFFYALSHGELAVTATVLATYPVYTVLFSIILNDEVLTPELLFFVMLAILGSVVATIPDKLKKSELKLSKAIVWPFLAAIGVGLSDTLSKGYIARSGDFSFLFALGFIQIPVALAYLRLERQSVISTVKGAVHDFNLYRKALIGGFLNIVGTGFLWLSFSYAPASIVSPITGASGALSVMFARFAFAEKLSVRKYLGILLALVGVFGIALVYKE